MDRQAIIEQLSEDIITYVMAGTLDEQFISNEIRPEDLEDRFTDYDSLLDLHFVLKEEVVEFVRRLPKRLRTISTDTKTVSNTRRGLIDGHINWGSTIKERYTKNPSDRSIFVVDNRSEDYDTNPNIVLKRVISEIYNTVNQSRGYLRENYDWASESWRGKGELLDELKRIVERNVHIKRIREPETYEPTERMLIAAENSRQPIYQEAAKLYRTFNEIKNGNQNEIQSLLENTAITPDDDDTLFELFVLFRFVSVIESFRSDSAKFETIREGRDEVAHFDESPQLVLYYDQAGTDRELSFLPEEEIDGRNLTRAEKTQETALEVSNAFFGEEFESYTNRPDVLVLEIRDDATHSYEYLITEVKNSARTKRIRKGIKETLEYLAFLSVEEDFVYGTRSDEEYFGNGWNGVLVIQDLDDETASLEEQTDSPIKIVQASDLEEDLQNILENTSLNIVP